MCLDTGTTIRRPEDRILHAQSGGENCGDADEAIAVVGCRPVWSSEKGEKESVVKNEHARGYAEVA